MPVGGWSSYVLGAAISVAAIILTIAALWNDIRQIFDSAHPWHAFRHSAMEIQAPLWAVLAAVAIQIIFGFVFLPMSFPMDIAVEASSKNYADKEPLYGLIWQAGSYSELQITFHNPTLYTYSDLNIRIYSALPIHKMVQRTNVPNCSVSPDVDLSQATIFGNVVVTGLPQWSIFLKGNDGKDYESPLNFPSTPLPSTLMGTNQRYRIECDKFGGDSDLGFFSAAIDPNRPVQNVLPRPSPYVIVSVIYEVEGHHLSLEERFGCLGGTCARLDSAWFVGYSMVVFPVLVLACLVWGGMWSANFRWSQNRV
jgi:hypothetical protein